MAPQATIPALPDVPAQAVSDYACEKCGHLMKLRRSREQHWFYGCSRWPDCYFTFDADQETGAPILHTRHGIPFRRDLKLGPGALFVALKKDGFNPEAGRVLEQAKTKSKAKRRQALKDSVREEVKARITAAALETPEEWLEFVLEERELAIQQHIEEEYRTFKQEMLNIGPPRTYVIGEPSLTGGAGYSRVRPRYR